MFCVMWASSVSWCVEIFHAVVMFFVMKVVGVGSFLFHATLKLSMQV